MAYAAGLGPVGGDTVGVQIPPPAQHPPIPHYQMRPTASARGSFMILGHRFIWRLSRGSAPGFVEEVLSGCGCPGLGLRPWTRSGPRECGTDARQRDGNGPGRRSRPVSRHSGQADWHVSLWCPWDVVMACKSGMSGRVRVGIRLFTDQIAGPLAALVHISVRSRPGKPTPGNTQHAPALKITPGVPFRLRRMRCRARR